MARNATHTLEFNSSHIYPASEIERRQLPDLLVTLDYLGWDEDKTHHFEGKVKIHEAGHLFLQHLPAHMKKMVSQDLNIEAKNKREATREAIDWADELIAEFMASGLFSQAVLDATGIERGKFEYEPMLKVVEAKVFKVK